MNDPLPKYLTLKEVERLTGVVSANAIRQALHQGRKTPFPIYKGPGRKDLLVLESDLRTYLAALKPVTVAA